MSHGPTHYEVLRIARDASAQDVRTAYRRAAQLHHPDRAGAGSQEAMARVNEAYAVLSHPQRRASYDQWMLARDARRRADAAAAAAQPTRLEEGKAWGLVAATAAVALLVVGTVLFKAGLPSLTGGARPLSQAGAAR